MASKKAQVEKQVQSILAKCRTEVQKRGEGLTIAKLYMTIKDYVTAKRYVEGFLQDKLNNPEGYELLAEIHEALRDKENALKCYKIALEHGGSKYTRLLLKICELVCDIESDVIILQYWLGECEKVYPKSCTAVRLKAHIHNRSRSENSATAKSQLDMHLDLISSYTSSNQYVQAYDVTFTINKETKFQDDLLWFEQVQHVFMEYGELWSEMKKDHDYNLQYLYTLRNYAYLCMGTSDIEDCVFALQSFDKQLKNALELKFNDNVWNSIVQESKAQLFFLAGVLLLKKAQKCLLPWEDVKKFSGACFLASLSIDPILPESTVIKNRKLYKWWSMQSYDRYSQIGHILYNVANGNALDWSKSIESEILTVEGHKAVCQILYDEHYDAIILKASYLCNASERFRSTSFSQLITKNLLHKADEVSFEVHIKDLSSLVWLCLQYYTADMHVQPYYPFFRIENLRFGVSNIKTSVMSSLCQTDMLVFLMATVQCTASRIKLTDYPNEETRIMLSFPFPVCLKQQLCTEEQAQWWSAAYQFFTNSLNPKEMRIRHRLVRGIETVRLVGTHGVSLQLLVHIAKSLDEKLKVLRQAKKSADSSSSEIIALENRAAIFWNHAKSSIEEIQKKNNSQLQSARIFQEPRDTILSDERISHARSEVIFASSLIAMKKSEYNKAVDGFRQINTPEAKLYMAKALRRWSKKNVDKDHNKGNNLLQEARETLYELLESVTTNPEAKEFTEPANKELDKIDRLMYHLFKDPSETYPLKSYSDLSSVEPESSKLGTDGLRENTEPFASTPLKSNQPTRESSKMDQETPCYSPMKQHPSHNLTLQINYLNQNCQKLKKDFEKIVDENKKNEKFLVEFITGQYDTILEDTRQQVEQVRQNNEELKDLVEQNRNTTCAFMDSTNEEKTVLTELKSQVEDLMSKVSPPLAPTDDTAPKFKEEENYKRPGPGQNRAKSQHRNNTQTSTTNSDHLNETNPHSPFPDLSRVDTEIKFVETDSLRRKTKPSSNTTVSQMGGVEAEAASPPVALDGTVPKFENPAPNQNNAERRPKYLTRIFPKSSTLNYLLYFGVTILILFLYPFFLYYFLE